MARTRAQRLPELRLAVQYPGGSRDAPGRAQVRRWVRASCALPAEVAVRFVAEDEGRTLNRDYRGKDYATNVLSFTYGSDDFVSGDLVLCRGVIEREARDQGKTTEAHYAHMVVHGMLHLQGHEHETSDADAERMEAIERDIMAALGYPDPYA